MFISMLGHVWPISSLWCPKKYDWKWCFFLLYLNPCKRKKHDTTSMWGCCEVTTINWFMVSLQLVRSSVAWAFTPAQLLCNSHCANISFACEILFAVISPWSSSDLAAIISRNSLFVYMGFSSICPIPTFWFYPRWGCAFSNALYCTVLIFDTEVHWNNYLKYALSAWSQLIWNQTI